MQDILEEPLMRHNKQHVQERKADTSFPYEERTLSILWHKQKRRKTQSATLFCCNQDMGKLATYTTFRKKKSNYNLTICENNFLSPNMWHEVLNSKNIFFSQFNMPSYWNVFLNCSVTTGLTTLALSQYSNNQILHLATTRKNFHTQKNWVFHLNHQTIPFRITSSLYSPLS